MVIRLPTMHGVRVKHRVSARGGASSREAGSADPGWPVSWKVFGLHRLRGSRRHVFGTWRPGQVIIERQEGSWPR